MPTSRDNRRGIIALVAGIAVFTANDTIMKGVMRELPAGEVIFVRGAFTIVVLGLAVVLLGHVRTVRAAFTPFVAWRTIFDAVSSSLFIVSLAHMRIADASAVLLTVPLITTAISVALLGEQVGWRRWSAVTVGFLGVLLVVKPTPAAFDPWALVALASALASASRDIMTRRIDPAVPSITITFLGACLVTAAGLLMIPTESWRVPATSELGWLALAACLLGLATYFVTLAFRGAETSVVAPFRYSLLLFALIAGFLVFGELPDLWALMGALLIVGSGLYVLHRETVRRRTIVPPNQGLSP